MKLNLKNPWALFLLLFLMVISVACSKDTDEVEVASTTEKNSGVKTESVVKEEKNEVESSGKLIVYTAGPKGLSAELKNGFEEQTGIMIEQFEGTTGKVLGRLEAEKSNPVADIVVLASWPSAIGMKEAGWTQSYSDAKNANQLHPTWKDEDNHFFGYSASALGITYNTNLVTTPPTDWSDFTKPEWKDRVKIPDPSISGSALDFVSGYLNDKGEDSWSLFEDLKANGVQMAGANAEALDPVVTGASSAVMAGVDYMAYSAKAKGEPIDIVYPTSGTVINPRPAMILKEAPNVENAQLFIDYLLSDEAQSIVAKAYLLPGRKDVPAENRIGVEDIKLLNYQWDWMMEKNDAISERFSEVFE